MKTYVFYAHVEDKQWGEPASEIRIGPFHLEASNEIDAEQTLRENLEQQGELINSIESRGLAPW